VEIALVAADRGVLDLIDYHLPDPLSVFYNRYNYRHGVAHFDSRALLLDPVLWKARDLPGGDKEGEEADDGGFEIRKDFRATAVFEPGLITGQDGRATFRFRLPDQLTTFRTTAVAVKDDSFGMAEGQIVVQNPINVRAALPRSLRVGDEVQAGVIVTNLDNRPRTVGVTLHSDQLDIRDRSEKRVSLQPGRSREVAFKLAAVAEGQAEMRFSIDSDVLQEQLYASLPVQAGVVREAFTIVGQTGDSVQEGVAVPEEFLGEAGEGLRITLDATLATSLTEAIRFLGLYPHDCLEQRTSKLFAYILFDWLLEDAGVASPSGGVDPGAAVDDAAGGDEADSAARRIQRELAALPLYQTADGGMSFWQDPGYRRSNYYVSLRTAHLIHLAERQGYDLPEKLERQSLIEYLGREYPAARPYLQSYALWVLSEMGAMRSFVREKLRELSTGGSDLGLLEQAFMALSYNTLGERQSAERLLERIRGYLRVGTGSVTLTGSVDSRIYYGGRLQAKAALLLLYSRLEPRSQIAQALADDLLSSTRKGYWQNTSNTGWILQAFAAYIDADQERRTDFEDTIRLGDRTVESVYFRGLSREPRDLFVEPAELLESADSRGGESGTGTEQRWLPLIFSKEGEGRLYYTATLSYSLEASRVEARDEGIGLFTEILDLAGKPVAGPLELGRVYKMRYIVYSGRDRDFLALRLPIPAGAEAIDGTLATSQIVPGQEEDEEYRYYGPVRRIYDNEVRFYYDSFYRGKQEGSFLFRTTTPGTFSVPPATAELMYEEEVFGRTGGREYRIVP
jgi:hypothetical protein